MLLHLVCHLPIEQYKKKTSHLSDNLEFCPYTYEKTTYYND